MGLLHLILTVYSFAATISCAGVRLASTRMIAQTSGNDGIDTEGTFYKCQLYTFLCGAAAGLVLYISSGEISLRWFGDIHTSQALKILSFGLPFAGMNAAYDGYFTAKEKIKSFSVVRITEECVRMGVTTFLLNRYGFESGADFCRHISAGMTASVIYSVIISTVLKDKRDESSRRLPTAGTREILRIALPDAFGTSVRSILLSIEHMLIPKGLEKSGKDASSALSAYGNIHAMAMPLILYPCAVLNSLSVLMIPRLAELKESKNTKKINKTAESNLKKTFLYSLCCSVLFWITAPVLSRRIYKTDDVTGYIRIMSPLIPVMYSDTVTDGILKGLDQQTHSMTYNLIDSAVCILLVVLLLPEYSVKGYIFTMYFSEILNFSLSFGRLTKVCNIGFIRHRKVFSEAASISAERKKCSAFHGEYEYQ